MYFKKKIVYYLFCFKGKIWFLRTTRLSCLLNLTWLLYFFKVIIIIKNNWEIDCVDIETASKLRFHEQIFEALPWKFELFGNPCYSCPLGFYTSEMKISRLESDVQRIQIKTFKNKSLKLFAVTSWLCLLQTRVFFRLFCYCTNIGRDKCCLSVTGDICDGKLTPKRIWRN